MHENQLSDEIYQSLGAAGSGNICRTRIQQGYVAALQLTGESLRFCNQIKTEQRRLEQQSM